MLVVVALVAVVLVALGVALVVVRSRRWFAIVDDNMAFIGLDSSVPVGIRRKVQCMAELGAPTAVFVSRPHPR